MPKIEWKLGEPGATEVIIRNVAFYDKIRTILTRRCRAPGCGYVISSIEESYGVPEYGSVCHVCYEMYQALQSPRLKNLFYFMNLHEQWKKEKDDWRRRDRLGL